MARSLRVHTDSVSSSLVQFPINSGLGPGPAAAKFPHGPQQSIRAMPASPNPRQGRIFRIRGHRVILDVDLARLYGVKTHVFNQAVKQTLPVSPKTLLSNLPVSRPTS
ncbi:MAG: ORF6N domain-containing protein [bacterium]|nr:ORF6N domain-containing protein [bacterium]